MDSTATVSGVEVNVVSARIRLRQYVSRALLRLRMQEAIRALNVVILLSLVLLMVTIFADRYCSLTRMGINPDKPTYRGFQKRPFLRLSSYKRRRPTPRLI